MDKDPDLFGRISGEWAGLIIAGLGALLLIGALRRWKWTLDMTGQKSGKPFGFLTLMHDLFGEEGVRVGVIILAVVMVVYGLVLSFLAE